MGNRLSFGAEGTHEAEILQSPSTKDEAKAAGGYVHYGQTLTVQWLLRIGYRHFQMPYLIVNPPLSVELTAHSHTHTQIWRVSR